MTRKNIDVLQMMNATQLSRFLYSLSDDFGCVLQPICLICAKHEKHACDSNCEQGVKEWLESEAEQ